MMENPFVFPQGVVGQDGREIRREGGMTLRDYFAGQVMAGIVSILLLSTPLANELEVMARACYVLADAMLAEREKKHGK